MALVGIDVHGNTLYIAFEGGLQKYFKRVYDIQYYLCNLLK